MTLWLYAGILAAVPAQTVSLTTDFQDSASKVVRNSEGRYEGICVDLIRLIEHRSRLRFVLPEDFSSLKRIEDDLANDKVNVVFALLRNPDRERLARFVVPLYPIRYVVVARADDTVAPTSAEEFKTVSHDRPVLTVFGSMIAGYIASLGLKADEGGMTVAQNFEKILAGRARFLVYQDLALRYELSKPEFRGKLKILPFELKSQDLWLVASAHADPAIIAELKGQIEWLKSTGLWDQTVDKYLK
jgi:polar amino acid transport system substrate-binding protein